MADQIHVDLMNASEGLRQIWNHLRRGLISLYYGGGRISKMDYMKLQDLVFQYINYIGFVASELREHLTWRIINFLDDHVSKLAVQLDHLPAEEHAYLYTTRWEQYKKTSRTLSGVCHHINRNKKMDAPEILQFALQRWRDILFERIHIKITRSVLEIISKQRNGENVNVDLIRRVISSYIELGSVHDVNTNSPSAIEAIGSFIYRKKTNLELYERHFEKQFLEETELFYLNYTQEFMEQNTVRQYVIMAEQRLFTEERNGSLQLNAATLERLMRLCENIIIKKHYATIQLEYERLVHLNTTSNDYFLSICMLMARLDDPLSFRKEFERRLKEEGNAIVDGLLEHNDPVLFFNSIVGIHSKYQKYLKSSFRNNSIVVSGFDNMFAKIINNKINTRLTQTSYQPAEMISIYCDFLLKDSLNVDGSDDLNENFDKVIIVLKYLEDPDLFLKFYLQSMTNRVLSMNQINDNGERCIIGKLKTAFGRLYTAKLDRLIKDIELSRVMNGEFEENSRPDMIKAAYAFQVSLLAFDLCPFKKQTGFTLPQEFKDNVAIYSDLFKSKFASRKLLWMHNIASGEVIANYFGKGHIFRMSAYQIAIVLMYNDRDSYSIGELAVRTNIDFQTLLKVTCTLINAGLLELPNGEIQDDMTAETMVELAKEYNNTEGFVNINLPLKATMTLDQRLETEVYNDKEKMIQIQAAVVRTMKAEKSCSQNRLVEMVIEKLTSRFSPCVNMIKRAIEILTEKDYLSHAEGQIDIYIYVA